MKAKELSFTADALTGKEAERIGLVNIAAPLDKLEETLQLLAQKIMANSPQSIVAYKHLYNTNENLSLYKSLELEFESEFDINDTDERLGGFKK